MMKKDLILTASIGGSVVFLSLMLMILTFYIHKKTKRINHWQITTAAQPVTNSAPISRSSSSCLINLEKTPQISRSRSASFGEDLTARLHTLAADNSYHSYSPAKISSIIRSVIAPSVRLSSTSNTPSTVTSNSTSPSVTFQIRYEQGIETLFITIFQLNNYLPSKNTQSVFVILYLLPNDDEQRQTRSTTNGVFHEQCDFPLKSDDLLKRTLRLTAYTVDSVTRIRNILGHVFIKFDQFIGENQNDKTFSTHTLSECLRQELQIRLNYLGELILTNTYLKDQNLLQIHIQQINNLNIEQLKSKSAVKAHFSGQLANMFNRDQWINSSSFVIPSSSSFRVDQNINLTVRSSLFSISEDYVECHLRLHLHGFNQIHSHARWQHSLRSNLSETLTVPLVAF